MSPVIYAKMNSVKIIKIILIGLILLGLGSCTDEAEYTNSQLENNYSSDPVTSQTQVSDLWTILPQDFKLPNESHSPEVQKQIRWFMRNPSYLSRMAAHARPYLYYIYSQVKKRNLPGELVLLPFIESAYDPLANSVVGASGLWQLMPGTATGFGLKEDWWYDGRRDVTASTNAALDYLTYLDNFFNGNWLLALAAYDSGEGTVLNAIKYNVRHHRKTDFWSLGLPQETKTYVPKLLALATIISHPDKYPIKLPDIPSKPFFEKVHVGSQIGLVRAAKLAGIKVNQLVQLNPAYSRWATDPNGPYQLILPIDKAAEFEANLAKLPKSDRVQWRRYKIKVGDTLGEIARQFNTDASILRQVNHMHNNLIRAGELILIPYSSNPVEKDIPTGGLENKLVYMIKPGDSLWSIGHRYHVSVAEIQYWNKVSISKPLKPGDELIIWLPRPEHHELSKAKEKKKHHEIVRFHTVRPGDSLYVIARKYHTSVKELRRHNHIKNNIIHAGEVLKIVENKA